MRLSLRRRQREAELAALAASVDDERFDPALILDSARVEYDVVAGNHAGAEMEAVRRRFGAGGVKTLLTLGYVGEADPSEIHVHLSRDAQMRLVATSPATIARRAQVVVRVAARARSWLGDHGFARAVLRNAVSNKILFRRRQLVAYWVFAADPCSPWRLERSEYGSTGTHHLAAPLDGNLDVTVRDEAVLDLAAADARGELGSRSMSHADFPTNRSLQCSSSRQSMTTSIRT